MVSDFVYKFKSCMFDTRQQEYDGHRVVVEEVVTPLHKDDSFVLLVRSLDVSGQGFNGPGRFRARRDELTAEPRTNIADVLHKELEDMGRTYFLTGEP